LLLLGWLGSIVKKIGGKQEPVLYSDLYIHVSDMPKKHILISSMFSIVLSK
jgi:hypothetical protein